MTQNTPRSRFTGLAVHLAARIYDEDKDGQVYPKVEFPDAEDTHNKTIANAQALRSVIYHTETDVRLSAERWIEERNADVKARAAVEDDPTTMDGKEINVEDVPGYIASAITERVRPGYPKAVHPMLDGLAAYLIEDQELELGGTVSEAVAACCTWLLGVADELPWAVAKADTARLDRLFERS